MTNLIDLSTYIEQQTTQFAFPQTPQNLYDPLRYFMTLGGKRMRPILTLMSAELFGIAKEEAVSSAMAIELFHNFSLIHDDIMDMAPLRRGKPTVHTQWNDHIAILSGDVLFVEAYAQLAKTTDDRLSPLLIRFNQTAREVCEGQQMDMDFEQRTDVSIDEYIEMIRLKTSVLLGCALEFGAILGRKDQKNRMLIYDFGVQLGVAFQIQDDMLDLYADPKKFGKQVGGDILSNKKTLLLLNAQQIASETNDSRVDELLKQTPTPEKISTAQLLFQEIGAVEKTQNQLNQYYSQAMSDLNQLDVSTEQKKPLQDLAEYLINREH